MDDPTRPGPDVPVEWEVTFEGLTLGTDRNGGFWFADRDDVENYTVAVARLEDIDVLLRMARAVQDAAAKGRHGG